MQIKYLTFASKCGIRGQMRMILITICTIYEQIPLDEPHHRALPSFPNRLHQLQDVFRGYMPRHLFRMDSGRRLAGCVLVLRIFLRNDSEISLDRQKTYIPLRYILSYLFLQCQSVGFGGRLCQFSPVFTRGIGVGNPLIIPCTFSLRHF